MDDHFVLIIWVSLCEVFVTHLGAKGLFDSRDSKLELRMSIGAPCSPLFIVRCLLVSRAGLDKGILFLRLLYLIWDKLIP